MRILTCLLLAAAIAAPASAQRRFRFGPTLHSIGVDDGSGTSHGHTALGVSIAALTADDAEMGFTVSRYDDLSSDACVRQMTFYGLDSYYYPVGSSGIAPFATAQLGLGRVAEADVPLLFACSATTSVSTTTEIGLAYGLGVRVGTRAAPRRALPSRHQEGRQPGAAGRLRAARDHERL